MDYCLSGNFQCHALRRTFKVLYLNRGKNPVHHVSVHQGSTQNHLDYCLKTQVVLAENAHWASVAEKVERPLVADKDGARISLISTCGAATTKV